MPGWFHNKGVQALSAWLTLATVGWAVLSRLTPDIFGPLSWPEAIVVGIALALATSLAIAMTLAVGAFGFRLIWPLPAPRADEPNPHESINTRVKQSVTATRKRVDDVETALRETIAVNDRKARERHEPLQANYTAILRDYQNMRGLEAKITEKMDALKDADREAANQLSTLFMALQAVFARERLRELHDLIREKVLNLTQNVDAGIHMNEDDWRLWQIGEKQWDQMMAIWCDIADRYNPTARRRILHTEPGDYVGSRWENVKREQFPGDDQLHLYKTFVIRHHNWVRVEPDIVNRVHFAAFGGPSATKILSDITNPVPETVEIEERIPREWTPL